jgi:hypothetical protein
VYGVENQSAKDVGSFEDVETSVNGKGFCAIIDYVNYPTYYWGYRRGKLRNEQGSTLFTRPSVR